MATVTATAASGAPPSLSAAWLAKGGIAGAALLLAAVVVRSGIASSLAPVDPIHAATFAPGDARVAAAAARARVERGEAVSSPEVHALVASALARDVTLTPAIELRGLEFASRGDTARAARLFALSRAISRRSLGTHLWLIQRAVERGDVGGALGEFDLALRTSEAAPRILFPVLARATADPTLQTPLARMLDRPSDWRELFLDYAIRNPDTAATLTPILLRMHDRGFVKTKQIDRALIAALVKKNAFGAAQAVEAGFGPAAPTGTMVRDPQFAETQFHYPFGWHIAEGGGSWAVRDRARGRPALVYRGETGTAGQVAAQLLTLEPGTYRLTAASSVAPSDPQALPFWTVTCGGGHPVQVALVDQPADGSAAHSEFTVPAGCSGQWLALNLRSSDRADGVSGAIAGVSIAKR